MSNGAKLNAPPAMTLRPNETSLPARARTNPLLWLNLVCLDAPIVAVSWQCLFARSFQIPLAHGGTAALFLTAWLIYLADRFGDSLSVDASRMTSRRQRFCLRHRFAWMLLLAIIGLTDLWVIVRELETRILLAGVIVGIFALVYLLLNQLAPALWQRLPLKEASIGFLFAAGTVVVPAVSLTSAIIPSWLLFAGLCSSNCICIAVWERELDRQQNRVSVATEFPAIQTGILPALLLFGALALILAIGNAQLRALCFCLALSAGLLAAVRALRNKIQSDIRTALADLVLLTPLLFLF